LNSRLSLSILAIASLGLSGCGEFGEGMSRGIAMQQEYQQKLADPWGTHLAELPPFPGLVASLPISKFYRCTSDKRSFDYVYFDGEWYHKAWRDDSWQPIACNKGRHRDSSWSSSSAACGFDGRKFWNRTLIFFRNGSDYSEESVDTKNLVYRSKYDQGKGEKTSEATCKVIEVDENDVPKSRRRP